MKRLRRPDRILFLIASDNTTGKKLIRHAAWKAQQVQDFRPRMANKPQP
jgi:hypothetical protein